MSLRGIDGIMKIPMSMRLVLTIVGAKSTIRTYRFAAPATLTLFANGIYYVPFVVQGRRNEGL